MYLIILLLIIVIILLFNWNNSFPVFLYHQINEYSNVDKNLFKEHLKIIKNSGYKTLKFSELENVKLNRSEKYCLISFDDGYYDNYKNAYPLLKQYNIKATIFLNTAYIKKTRDELTIIEPSYEANYKSIQSLQRGGTEKSSQYLTEEEIKEMYESGLVDFQLHSHRHMPVFTNLEVTGFYQGKRMDSTDLFCYKGEIEEGFPIIKKRGEYSSKGYLIKRELFQEVANYYNEELINFPEKLQIIKANEFLQNSLMHYVYKETDEDFKKRVIDDLCLNRESIKRIIGKTPSFFCWPWGHKSKNSIKLLKENGIKGFVTTIKGTNHKNVNFDKIRRIELRKFTKFKFKLNLLINRNFILGRIYEFLS